jgi:hypothetical protein
VAGCPRTVIRGGIAGVWAHEIDHLVTSEARALARFASQLRKPLAPPTPGIPPLPDLTDTMQTKLSLFHDGKNSGALRFEMYLGPPDNPRYVMAGRRSRGKFITRLGGSSQYGGSSS